MLVRTSPGVHRFLLFQALAHQHLAGAQRQLIDPLGQQLQHQALALCQRCNVVARCLRGHQHALAVGACAAIGHLVVHLGNLRVALRRMPGQQVIR